MQLCFHSVQWPIRLLGQCLVMVPLLAIGSDHVEDTAVPAVRTPIAPLSPHINGPRIYGVRPGHPFLFHVPVTGDRPMQITANGLPSGLKLDSATGNITGVLPTAGESFVNLTASNSKGQGTATLHIVCGETICLTPPMGWNSWNCFHGGVDAMKIRSAADAFVSSGLIDHGWTYINIDDGWAGRPGSRSAGHIVPNDKFKDMKALSEAIHAKGLKFGIYTSPGPITCDSWEGSYQHEADDIVTYTTWGVDYLKYDGCTVGTVSDVLSEKLYAELLPDHAEELNRLGEEQADLELKQYNRRPGKKPTDPARQLEIRTRLDELHKLVPQEKQQEIADKMVRWEWQKMGPIVTHADRDIVYSISQGGHNNIWEWAPGFGANLWRVSSDIAPQWKSVESHAFGPMDLGLQSYASPGHWNDPDMLEIGNGKLTPDECYTHMTAWCMLAAPLLIGCDLTKMSPLTVSILSNDEVLAVDQDAMGKQASRAKQDGLSEVWTKPLEDGSVAVAFFNRDEKPSDITVQWTDLKLTGPQSVRDLWRQSDLGVQPTGYSVTVAPHSAELFKVSGRK